MKRRDDMKWEGGGKNKKFCVEKWIRNWGDWRKEGRVIIKWGR